MKRIRLRNKFVNSKSDTDRKTYNAQRDICVSLIRQAKKQLFSNLNTHDVTGNKTFWNTLKPLVTDKVKTKLEKNSDREKIQTQLNRIF